MESLERPTNDVNVGTPNTMTSMALPASSKSGSPTAAARSHGFEPDRALRTFLGRGGSVSMGGGAATARAQGQGRGQLPLCLDP